MKTEIFSSRQKIRMVLSFLGIDRHLNTNLMEDIEMMALPKGWQTFTDPTTNKPYYHYKPTGHTTWNHPHSEEYLAEYTQLTGGEKAEEEKKKKKEVKVMKRPNRKRKAKGDDQLPQVTNPQLFE